jgi:replicative superfamily II helicase
LAVSINIGENVWTPNVDLAICTIEKANGLINRIIEEKLYFDIGFFIIDEFHLVILPKFIYMH